MAKTGVKLNIKSPGRLTMAFSDGLVAQNYVYNKGQLGTLARKSRIGTAAFDWQSYQFAYDDFGNMTSIGVSAAENGATATNPMILASYSYETGVNNGRLQKLTYGNGDTASYAYDIFDRVTSETYNNGAQYAYTYDADGNLAQQKSGAAEEYNYVYDSLGRLIRSNEYNGGVLEQRTEHIYDASDRLTKQSWLNDGGTTSLAYTYSGTTGLLTKLTAKQTPTSGSAKTLNISYGYTDLNQVQSKSVTGSATYERRFSYRYNTISNVNYYTNLPWYMNYKNGDAIIYGELYTYDSNGRLTKVQDSSDTSTVRATYGYDTQGQLTSAKVGSTSYTYTYDTAGNLITKKDGTTTHSYTYGNAKWRDLLTAYDGNSITYDGCGNPTKYHDGKTFTWTQGRRLSAIGTTISYSYDMAGVRSSKTVSGTTYSFTTLSGLVTRQEWGSNYIDFFYDENNQPFALNYNGTMYYYVLNAQGDVVGIMNSSKTLVATYTYDPWGKVIASTGTLASVNPLRYRGYYYDTETGFYYLQSRYYDPSIGRFINADSYASTDASGILSTNMFAYCENDPVNNSDATGEWAQIIIGAALGVGEQFMTDMIYAMVTGQPLDECFSSVGT